MILILRETDFKFTPDEINIFNINNCVKTGVMKNILSSDIVLFQDKRNKVRVIKNRFIFTDAPNREYTSIDKALRDII